MSAVGATRCTSILYYYVCVAEDVTADLFVTGKMMEKKNKKYLQIDTFNSNIKVGDSKLKFLSPAGKTMKQNPISMWID